MLARPTVCALLLGGIQLASADVVLLKDKASVTGKVIAEKRDQIAIDVGYTVLVIPKSAIARIEKDADAEPKKPKTKTAPVTNAPPEAEIFRSTKSLAADRSVRDLVVLLGEGVVQVRTPGGLGSGFILNEEGYLITNFHVIEGETQIGVEVYSQKDGQLERKVFKQVRIIAMNRFQDLTLLKIDDKEAPKFTSVPLGVSDDLAVGERVFAIGSPLGFERTVTEGIVSTKTRQVQGELYIQTSTQINPGNSGGPLFNLRGEVVGVTNMKYGGEGLGFAIPVDMVKNFLKNRDAFAYDTDNPSNPFRYLQPPALVKQDATNAVKSGKK